MTPKVASAATAQVALWAIVTSDIAMRALSPKMRAA
jgi:hypothetical protein